MEIFVNELSLHEQFYNRSEFNKAVRIFYSVFAELNKKRVEHKLYWDEDPFQIYKALENEVFISSLNKIRDKSLRQALIGVLRNKLNVKDWKSERIHSPDDWYQCKEDLVTDTSMAELAERKLQNADLLELLINFPQSKYAVSSFVIIIKKQDDDQPIRLACIDDRVSLAEWLETNLHLSSFEYDNTSTSRPTDEQTILRDKNRFKPTSMLHQGRKVYREAQTGHYWYVDNFHTGSAAHLEVFNLQGKHIGEADLDGNIDPTKRDTKKRLDLR